MRSRPDPGQIPCAPQRPGQGIPSGKAGTEVLVSTLWRMTAPPPSKAAQDATTEHPQQIVALCIMHSCRRWQFLVTGLYFGKNTCMALPGEGVVALSHCLPLMPSGLDTWIVPGHCQPVVLPAIVLSCDYLPSTATVLPA